MISFLRNPLYSCTGSTLYGFLGRVFSSGTDTILATQEEYYDSPAPVIPT
jgi:hypothetical protein